MDSANTTMTLQESAVGQVMTSELLTVNPHDSVLMAWELMRRGRYHHLPVVTDDGRFLGLIDAATIVAHWKPEGPGANSGPVSDLLQGHWRNTITRETTVRDAATIMTRRHIDALAVVEGDDLLVGLLTTNDLLAALAGDTPVAPATQGASTNAPGLYRIEPVMPARADFGGLAPD